MLTLSILYLESVEEPAPVQLPALLNIDPVIDVATLVDLSSKSAAEQDFDSASQLYAQAAEMRNPTAQERLGFFYQIGLGVLSRDLSKAVELYQKAADLNESNAQIALGGFYWTKTAGLDDPSMAALWFERAALQGHTAAQNNLAYCYQHGIGVGKNRLKAAEMYKEAALKGNAKAQTNVGSCYYWGIGYEEDREEAAKWLELAATQGETTAQFWLADCYACGVGVPLDAKKAADLLERATLPAPPPSDLGQVDFYDFFNGIEASGPPPRVWHDQPSSAHLASKSLKKIIFDL
ncbi:hypothetical protein HDU93_003602 [Gonapodya sp. JEL0774]|nr:hypothetical protein HDU93_003602 [Gonapodya sp. JEL0774]